VINVEMIGASLMIQQYVGDTTDPDHCRMVSLSDVFSPQGRTPTQVVWDLSVKAVDDQHSEYTNSVVASAPDEFLAFIKEHGITFEEAADARQKAGSAHNEKETPLEVSLGGVWF
jgi:hypothetical protein